MRKIVGRVNVRNSDTNGKKMLHSFFVSEFLLFFLIFTWFSPAFSHSIDSSENETLVEGK